MLNSPYTNQIGQIESENMWVQAQKEQVPFFKWQNWIRANISAKYAKRRYKAAEGNAIQRHVQTKMKSAFAY